VEEAARKATEPLIAVIAEKDKEILRLKTQLEKDSSNSSKPSSGNGFKKVPNNREKSEKKQGGQYGHKGFRLNIPENLEELYKLQDQSNIYFVGAIINRPRISGAFSRAIDNRPYGLFVNLPL